MNIERIKEILKSKKVAVATVGLIGVLSIGVAAGLLVHNKSKVENDKIVQANKENDNSSKENKEEKENLKVDENKSDESKENEKVEEEKEEVKIEETKKVESSIEDNSNSTSNNVSSNSSSSVNNTTTNKEEVVEKPTTPQVSEKPQVEVQKPTQQVPTPVVKPEEPKPVYPTVEEVKQRLISYGQSLGLKYDPSLVSEGWSKRDTQQMWSSSAGNSTDGQRLFNGFEFKSFAIVVTDLGEFCHMEIYAPWE